MESSRVVVQSTRLLVCSMCWNPKEAGSNASEEMSLLARREQAKSKNFLLLCPQIGFQHKVWSRQEGRFSQLKGSGLKGCLPSLRSVLEVDFSLKQKILHICAPFWVLFIPNVVRLTTKNCHHMRYETWLFRPLAYYSISIFSGLDLVSEKYQTPNNGVWILKLLSLAGLLASCAFFLIPSDSPWWRL